MIREEDIARFVELLRRRLRVGAEQYGNSSFERPLVDVIGEVEQELLDVAGWGLIAWTRLQRLRERVEHIEGTGGNVADIDIKIRTWVRGTADDERSGLLGYLSVFYGSLVLDGVTVRRTADGRLCLSYPERRDGKGRRHSVVRPIDDEARRAIEAVVFAQAMLRSEVER